MKQLKKIKATNIDLLSDSEMKNVKGGYHVDCSQFQGCFGENLPCLIWGATGYCKSENYGGGPCYCSGM